MRVVLEPVPCIAPGLINQVPVAGKPFNTTLPATPKQVDCVIVPTVGAANEGRPLIVTLVPEERQPSAFFAVTVYVPGTSAVNVPLVV